MMDDLVAWLTQICDEDESLARRAARGGLGESFIDNYGHLSVPAHQVLARTAADREILQQRQKLQIELCDSAADPSRQMNLPILVNVALALNQVVKSLGSAHADRPGYREEWRP